MLKTRLILFAATTTLFLSSCVKSGYYTPEPLPPVGYSYIFDDNFDYDAHNWSFRDDGNKAYVNVSGGTLNYNYNPANDGSNTVAISTGVNMRYDFLIQTSIRSDYSMGLVFGVSDMDYGYSLFIDNEGYFAVYKEGSAGVAPTTILDWQYSTALSSGWNDIELEQVGNSWIGYANGAKLFEMAAQPIYGTKIGYIVLAGTNGQADYLTVQW